MAKRFHDTEIWEQDWYIALPNKYKLLWMFIKDRCDDCGVWRPNKEILQRIISEPLNLNEFLVFINTDEKERVLVLKNGRWFLRDYFFFQYGENFNPHSPVHRGVLKRLVNHGIHIRELSKVIVGKLIDAEIQLLREIAYTYPKDMLLLDYKYPINRVKDKDKDKDKDSLKEGGAGETKNDNKNQNNGKQPINFKAQGENLYAERIARHQNKIDENRRKDNLQSN